MTSDWKERAVRRKDFRHTKEDDQPKPHRSKKDNRTYYILYRVKPGRSFNKSWENWTMYKRYRTKEQRDQAYEVLMNRNDLTFDYKLPDES